MRMEKKKKEKEVKQLSTKNNKIIMTYTMGLWDQKDAHTQKRYKKPKTSKRSIIYLKKKKKRGKTTVH